MEWVAIDVHIAGDAVTHRLADAFRLRVAEAAGLLTLAYAGMAQHAQDGSLSSVTDSQIESWAFWHGKRGAFATFFRAQLCDEAGTVRAWERYNGASIREAKAGRTRMREYRAKKKAERSANGTQDGTAYGTGSVRHNLTGPDLTRPDQNISLTPRKPATVREIPTDDPRFAAVWSLYPRRAGGNSRSDAYKQWRARIAAGVDPSEIEAGVRRYAAYCDAEKQTGTKYVKQGATFFGVGEHWSEPWSATPPTPLRVVDGWFADAAS